MNKKVKIVAILNLLAFCIVALGGELSVPDDYNTIQAAIDAAYNGDTVIVADGTYTGPGNRDISFRGKAITVRSQSGPDNCIIDCNGSASDPHRGFTFHMGEGPNSVVAGLTITGGSAPVEDGYPAGGAIFCIGSSPTITHCVISGNSAGSYPTLGYGGGICVWDNSSPTISYCTLSGNSASDAGGAIDCYNSTRVIVRNCTLKDNTAHLNGAGIDTYNSRLIVSDSCFIGNLASLDGGGINLYGSKANLTNCTITYNAANRVGGGVYSRKNILRISNSTIGGNSTSIVGGGIYCEYGSLTIINSALANNTSNFGGGIHSWQTSPIITGCTISGNTARKDFGGGIYCRDGRPVITNCTLSGNSSDYHGGGIYYKYRKPCTDSDARIINCTFSGNSAVDGRALGCDFGPNSDLCTVQLTNCIFWDEGNEIQSNQMSMINVAYSDVQGGWPGEGNIDADPWFVEPGYWADANEPNVVVEPNEPNAVWIEGDYRLLADSPCIDAGDPNYVPEPNETDLDGNPRVIDGDEDGVAVVDMGAYEFWPAVKAKMKLTPQTLNCASSGKFIKAHIALPEAILPEDIDVNEPAVAEPMDIESEYIKVISGDTGPVKLEIAFSRAVFCETLGQPGAIEVTVTGLLTSGQEFYGADVIRIVGPERKRILRRRFRR